MKIQKLTVTRKEPLISGVYLLDLVLEHPVTYFPGQHVVLQVEPKIFRSYSIVELKDNLMTLLVDVRIGGPASKFFEACGPGSELQLIGAPLGRFVVHDTGKPKVFVATGTGLAPFVPMIKAVLDKDAKADVKLYFGARTVGEDYCLHFFGGYADRGASSGSERTHSVNGDGKSASARHPNFQIIHCISRPGGNLPDGYFEGRVTKVVPQQMEDCRTPEFYLCGGPQMVDDIQGVLRARGADANLFTEKYA